MNSFTEEFKSGCITRMEESLQRIRNCLSELTEEQIWKKPNDSLNSCGNLVLHLCGNIRQYGISSLGSTPDNRERDLEFSVTGGYTRKELIRMLTETISESSRTIKEATEENLTRFRSVQGFHLTGIGIIIHITEHLSYHTGQIAFWTKFLKNKDLGFYGGIDLNQKNS